MNAIIRNCSILGLLLTVGCATPCQPGILGRWTVSGTGDIVTLTRDRSEHLASGRARLTSGGKTISGSYRMVAPDVLVLTLPNGDRSSEPPRRFSAQRRPAIWGRLVRSTALSAVIPHFWS